ncbi:hypothetical protein A0H81_09981 [Grifola frondosa]|uniref:Uncharacterized protein n=1 Tax=Grifola frondosa TaxID=5627 RepID=A0A1C7M250_GRIFR|nr:hypothetical protein A0H81_09981 [Grifola frondosa]
MSTTDLDSVQRARHPDSRKGRLVLSSRFLSPQVDSASHGSARVSEHQQLRPSMHTPGPPDIPDSTISDLGSPRAPAATMPQFSKRPMTRDTNGGNYRPLKLGRSLHQRFDEASNRSPQDKQESTFSIPRLAPSESVPPNSALNVFHANDYVPRAQSRSASVNSSVYGRPDEDISSIMMRGATDLRNTMFEVEEQRREISFLQSQLESAKKEKDEMSQRLQAVKEAAKQSLLSSSARRIYAVSLEEIRSTMSDLKAQSEESFNMIMQARSSLPEVQELRSTVSEAMKSIETHLDNNGEWVKSSETKNIVNELELECSKSHQVADLLRDRLESVGTELIEAKSRISELETAQVADRAALCTATGRISDSSEQLTELAECLKRQQGELYEILAAAADAEARLVVTKEQYRHNTLEQSICQKDTELEALRGVQEEALTLRDMLQERDSRLRSLQSLQDELFAVKVTADEREATILALKTSNLAKDENTADLQARRAYTILILQLEAQIEESTDTIERLKENLRATEERERAALKEHEQHVSNSRVFQEKINDLEGQLAVWRKECETRKEKLHEAVIRCQVLEERFDDQSVTLRITKEANGDMQERLIAAEAAFAKDLESMTGKLKCEIAVLMEQRSHFQTKITDMEVVIKRLEETAVATKLDYEERLKHQDETYRQRWRRKTSMRNKLEDDLLTARSQLQSLEKQLSAAALEARGLREQLQEARLPSPAHEHEVRSLRSQIQAFEAGERLHSERAKTIEARYRAGDLNDEEKVFINTLVQTSQAIHEQELVASRNELRRRDNTVKDLRSKVLLLESTLAKHLNSQAKSKPQIGGENRSMIDPTSWVVSSEKSSSPATQAPDRDAPSVNVDSTVTAKQTPTPYRSARPVPVRQATVLPATPARVQKPVLTVRLPPSALKIPSTAIGGPENPIGDASHKPNFSRLAATDCSDDIVDFEDDAARKVSPPVSLGKRDKMSSPPKALEIPSAPRPTKRLRAATRKPEAQGAASKPIELAASKGRARRRR